mmetsp:Transcript_4585/g.6504  ORF Transcript_4585/g.6504 Transcript_4585/m.6504 type:complete len:473 (-) Transcript_4585:1139-2557(-)
MDDDIRIPSSTRDTTTITTIETSRASAVSAADPSHLPAETVSSDVNGNVNANVNANSASNTIVDNHNHRDVNNTTTDTTTTSTTSATTTSTTTSIISDRDVLLKALCKTCHLILFQRVLPNSNPFVRDEELIRPQCPLCLDLLRTFSISSGHSHTNNNDNSDGDSDGDGDGDDSDDHHSGKRQAMNKIVSAFEPYGGLGNFGNRRLCNDSPTVFLPAEILVRAHCVLSVLLISNAFESNPNKNQNTNQNQNQNRKPKIHDHDHDYYYQPKIRTASEYYTKLKERVRESIRYQVKQYLQQIKSKHENKSDNNNNNNNDNNNNNNDNTEIYKKEEEWTSIMTPKCIQEEAALMNYHILFTPNCSNSFTANNETSSSNHSHPKLSNHQSYYYNTPPLLPPPHILPNLYAQATIDSRKKSRKRFRGNDPTLKQGGDPRANLESRVIAHQHYLYQQQQQQQQHIPVPSSQSFRTYGQ